MSPSEPLKKAIQTASRRLRWQETVQATLPTLTLMLILTVALIWLGRVYPLTLPSYLLAGGLTITLLSLVILWSYLWLRPLSPIKIARQLDHRLQLEDRLTTTLELMEDDHELPASIIQAQLADTLRHLKKIDPAQAIPIHWSRPWLVGLVLVISLLITGMVLPNPQLPVLHQRAKNEEIIRKQKAQFEEIRADLVENTALMETPEGEEIIGTLDDLIEKLEENQMTPEEAMSAISEAEQELAEMQNEAESKEQTLNDVAEQLNESASTQEVAEALAEGNMEQAAEALSSAGENLENNPEAAQEMAEALQQAAQTAAEAGESDLAEALNQAAEAVASGDPQMSEEALQQAAQALAEAGEQLANQEAVEQALANIQEAREQLAEASGEGTGQGQGQEIQIGQGSGQGEGEGEGEGGGQGEGEGTSIGGSGREDPGEGAEGLNSDQAAPDAMSTDNGPNENQVEEYTPIYAPEHLGGEGGPIVQPDQQGATGGIPIGETTVDPNTDPNAAMVPYDQVYGQYSDAASQALDNNYIPLGMKDYVRHYFGALEPNSGGN